MVNEHEVEMAKLEAQLAKLKAQEGQEAAEVVQVPVPWCRQ